MESPQNDRAQRPIADILTDLAKPVPQRMIEQRKQGGAMLDFVPWHRAQRILDHYTRGYWQYEVVDKRVTDTHFLVTVRIIIHASDFIAHREGTGIEALDTSSYGDFQSNAEAQAFKRACARFGLALHLYDKD